MIEHFKIYVGTYGKYNSGSIEGAWIDLSGLSKNEFYAKCKDLHKDEHDPEYMFQDWDSIPDKLIGESWISDLVFDIIDLDLEDDRLEALLDFIESDMYYSKFIDNDIDDIMEAFEESYYGVYDSIEDYTDQLFDDLYLHDVPKHIIHYIDYKAFYHDNKDNYHLSRNGHLFNLR